jgi:hypothetical protein
MRRRAFRSSSTGTNASPQIPAKSISHNASLTLRFALVIGEGTQSVCGIVSNSHNRKIVCRADPRSTDTLLFKVEINLRRGAVFDDFLAV